MQRKDVPRLFDLLEELHQGRKKSRDTVTVAIWAEALKPWPYEQIRDAALQRARSGNRFFPDPPELAELLPAADQTADRGIQYAPLGPAECRCLERARAWKKKWDGHLHELGLPTLDEALEAGMGLGQWRQMMGAANAWDKAPEP